MIPRTISQYILDLSGVYPVVTVTGPRQSGKTTLVRHLFPTHRYVNFEDIEVKELAQYDPKGFIAQQTSPVIFDEVQKVPELLSYIMLKTDENGLPGQYILTGSEHFALSAHISQSLAGRTAQCILLPPSISELAAAGLLKANANDQLYIGWYPRVYDKGIPPADAYRDYISTYIERDVRSVKDIGNLSLFQRFMRLLAGRTGQIINNSSLANDLGVSYKTVEAWISVLEASFIVFRLEPYFKNYNKRIVKSPKLYFYDTGLAAYLMGVSSPSELDVHFARGALFENMVIADVQKQILHRRINASLYFWKDSTGNEIDCIVDTGTSQKAIEIKVSSTFRSDMLKNLLLWQELNSAHPGDNYLIYNGTESSFVKEIHLRNWRDMGDLVV